MFLFTFIGWNKVHCNASTKLMITYSFAAFCAFKTFMTIFCSSMRKARTIFSRTALWLKTPEIFKILKSKKFAFKCQSNDLNY